MRHPKPHDVAELCRHLLGSQAISVTRFPTGLCHYVYDVVMSDGRRVVARLASEQTRSYLQGGIYWSGVLRPMGVPLPKLLQADVLALPFGYMILERLPGSDLGHIYTTLSRPQKIDLVRRLREIQSQVATLAKGKGYGHVLNPDGGFPYRSWREVLDGQLLRSRRWTEDAAVVGTEHFVRVDKRLCERQDYLTSIAATAFLDDITTKNVLVCDGTFSGIVDVDEVCFGDPLFCLALTRMSLLARDLHTDYMDDWITALALNGDQLGALDLYTAIHCCTFIGEIGQQFNRAAPAPIDRGYLSRLIGLLDQIL
ncbi:MAG TPA: phosphotransferase [Humisphaera sp.]|jgi:hypothetical protein|nr:phosphotransferase [Humisphaera sp.]